MPVAIHCSGTLTGAGLAWGVHLSKQWELSPVLSFCYGIKTTYQEGWSIEHCMCVHKYTMCVYTHTCGKEKLRHSTSYGITSG